MKEIIIIGSGGHSRSVISVVKKLRKWKKISIIDTKFKGERESILGVMVLGGMEFIDTLNPTITDIFVAIGDNSLRKEMISFVIKKGFKVPNLINENATLDQDLILGFGNFIGSSANIGPNVQIGDGNIVNNLANIDHESKIGDWNHLSPSSVLCGRVNIGNLTWIGANSTILDGLLIADRTIVGAGAVVIENIIESDKVFAGVPAKQL
jgi:sugar O-acyltransferase (sialic acid O-acetyltransferase NeuD family)